MSPDGLARRKRAEPTVRLTADFIRPRASFACRVSPICPISRDKSRARRARTAVIITSRTWERAARRGAAHRRCAIILEARVSYDDLLTETDFAAFRPNAEVVRYLELTR